MVASFHFSETTPPPFHTRTSMPWKCWRTMGSASPASPSTLRTSTRRESSPGAFQFCFPILPVPSLKALVLSRVPPHLLLFVPPAFFFLTSSTDVGLEFWVISC